MISEDGTGTCKCLIGYTGMHKLVVPAHMRPLHLLHLPGPNCHDKVDECTDGAFAGVCQNGATCRRNHYGHYQCMCVGGFTGQHCETNVDDCKGNLCYEGSKCVDGVSRYHCECAADRMGVFCEHEDPCYGELGRRNCLHGTCDKNIESGNYTCQCEEGYEVGDV